MFVSNGNTINFHKEDIDKYHYEEQNMISLINRIEISTGNFNQHDRMQDPVMIG